MSDITALVNKMIKFTQPTNLSYSVFHILRAGLQVCPIYREGQKQTLKCGNDMFALQGGPPLYADAGIDES